MESHLFRARGKYKGTGRYGWVTKSWATNEEAAKRDAEIMRNSFTDITVVSENWGTFFRDINQGKRKRLPKRHTY